MTVQTEADSPPKTFENEDQLPRVPLPELSETTRRFLEWCAPLLTPEQRDETERAVERFLAPDSTAHTLHAELTKFSGADGVDSWLDEFWRDRYLGRRDRIALNANFFFLLVDPDSRLGQLDRAAGLIAASLNYKQRVDREELPPELLRGQPLSMAQNRYLFSSTRIPGQRRDTARTPYSEDWPGPSNERHIVVFYRGNAFRMDVIGPAGAPHTLEELVDGLRAVREGGVNPAEPGTSVGHLTTKARAEWAASRAALLAADPANAEALDTIETALFCVALEELDPSGDQEACDQLLHGDSGNRWFDKALTFIVFADGTAGVSSEHCNLDGTTVVSFVDAIYRASPQAHSEQSGARAQGRPALTPVTFELGERLRADVAGAGEAFAAYARANATLTVNVAGLTSELAKKLGCSPDAFAQMSFQLAHQRAKGLVGATYESIATRHWRGGRTEAMRVVTPEILGFVRAMDDPGADAQLRRDAFRAAAAAHVSRAKQCQAGDAPEQHLWELQMIARRTGIAQPPALYMSPGWLIMRDDYLSTSSLPTANIRYFGFGSTSEQCIGVGYGLLPTRFDLYLSTPEPVRDQMDEFARRLHEAAAELVTLLTEEQTG
jgi:carnitine O-acetyltransferase